MHTDWNKTKISDAYDVGSPVAQMLRQFFFQKLSPVVLITIHIRRSDPLVTAPVRRRN